MQDKLEKENRHQEIFKALVRLHPDPTKLLHHHLRDATEAFAPKNADEAVELALEFVCSAGDFCAAVMSVHVSDHPETAKECVPAMLEIFPDVLKESMQMGLKSICDKSGLDNPLKEASVNEKLRDEILATIKAHDHVKG